MLPSWFDDNRVYVRVNTPTDMFLLDLPEYKGKDSSLFSIFFSKERTEKFDVVRINNEDVYISKDEIPVPCRIVIYGYLGSGNNVIGFTQNKEIIKLTCDTPNQSQNIPNDEKNRPHPIEGENNNKLIFVKENGECKELAKLPRDNYKLVIDDSGKTITFNQKILFMGITKSLIDFTKPTYIYFTNAIQQLMIIKKEFREIDNLSSYQVGFSQIKLENFKGILEGEIKDLQLCNVILGSNNAGKTTLLEALYLLSDMEQKPPGFNNSFELLNYLHGKTRTKKSKIDIKFLSRFYSGDIRIKGDEKYVNIYDDRININGEKYKDVQDLIVPEKKEIDTLFFSHRLIIPYMKFIINNWSNLSNRIDIIQPVLDQINKMSNEKYILLTLEPYNENLSLYIVREDKRKVRLNDVGEGFQNFIIFKLLVSYFSPSMILIDDIENHINPLLMSNFIEELSQLVHKNRQVFVTTHNLLVAKNLLEGCGGKGIILDIDEKGKLKELSF
ncbi:ATP-dependent nuclease [Acidianus manzaensis]|uniref:ATPase AAA-type core domain-containing protein n=1 Tax=Acidianus manzaensis TaxID=282676 RepID=A0A1W6K2N4_9CREN|nr:ATP-binding protein [Acidianus manzaensis]ARM76811.1 hypothetical protein B6F84_12805 [Acidianus manzaensis]